jgi:hypothetical protein fuD12_02519
MSKYKVFFTVGVKDSEEMKVIDLIDDFGYTEEKAQKIFEDYDELQKVYEEWLYENIDTGYFPLESEEEIQEYEEKVKRG